MKGKSCHQHGYFGPLKSLEMVLFINSPIIKLDHSHGSCFLENFGLQLLDNSFSLCLISLFLTVDLFEFDAFYLSCNVILSLVIVSWNMCYIPKIVKRVMLSRRYWLSVVVSVSEVCQGALL